MLKAYSRNCKAHIKEFLGILHFTIILKKKIKNWANVNVLYCFSSLADALEGLRITIH